MKSWSSWEQFAQMLGGNHGRALMRRNTADVINYSSLVCWAVGNG